MHHLLINIEAGSVQDLNYLSLFLLKSAMLKSRFILKTLMWTLGSIGMRTSYAQDMQLHTTSDSINTTADVVKMKNGGRLTGEILRVRRGQLYFDSDIPGDVTIVHSAY